VLVAPVRDVRRLVSVPYHLPDWLLATRASQPDRRGLAEGRPYDLCQTAADL
jgi:hypothetical protein